MDGDIRKEKGVSRWIIRVLVCFLAFYGVRVLISGKVKELSIRSWVNWLAILAALFIGAMDIPEEHTIMHNGHKMIRVYAGFLQANDEEHAIYYEPVGIFFKKYTGEKGEQVYPFWE